MAFPYTYNILDRLDFVNQKRKTYRKACKKERDSEEV
jgi:hypothetical protein